MNRIGPKISRLLKAATILSLGGLAAGCSSDVIRFSDGFYTGAVPQGATQSASAGPATYGQPNYNPGVDQSATSSVGTQSVQRSSLPSPSASGTPQPQPATPVSASAGSSSSMATASVASSRYGELPPPSQPGGSASSTMNGSPEPLPQPAKPQAAAAPARSTVADGGGRYTVVAGDTLSGISRRTGASVDAIKRVNSMSTDTVRIGQSLVIPGLTPDDGKQVAAAPKVDPVTTSVARTEDDGGKSVTGYTPPKQAAKSESGSITNIETASTAKAPDTTGVSAMRWPVQGRVINAFGSNNGGKPNDGIDISAPVGTPVKAAENGVVIYAGDGLKELGKTVLVRHSDGMVTVYGHVSDITVSRGADVKRGEQIASSGMSGSAKQPQLHFEVRKNSKPVDPVALLQ